MVEEYTEEIKEAVDSNIDYLITSEVSEVALFLESVADSLYDGEILNEVAAALRDAEEDC